MVNENTQTFAKRWFLLALFCILSATNGFQSLEYTIINDLLTQYYNVSSLAIDWTSIIYMVVYVLFIFPATWFLDKFGLRWTLIMGTIGNCLGAWIKCASTNPGRFYVSFIGQTIAGISQVFILGIPPKLAAVWFGPMEVSTATAIGVFGNQIGCALGFLIPPLIVTNVSTSPGTNYSSELYTSNITTQLEIMFYGMAGLTTAITLLIFLFFSEKPAVPPSVAQMGVINTAMDRNFGSTLKKLVTNVNYMLLMVCYGLNVGSFYALSTLLNPILITYYPGQEANIGNIGLVTVVLGVIGALACGIWLDRTKRYKSTICFVYAMSLVGMLVFTCIISLQQIWVVYIVAALTGLFTGGFLPIGYEFSCELTYPLAEGTSSGLLNAAAELFAFFLTILVGNLLKSSVLYGNIAITVAFAIGTLVTLLIKSDLRRHNAELAPASKDDSNVLSSEQTSNLHKCADVNIDVVTYIKRDIVKF